MRIPACQDGQSLFCQGVIRLDHPNGLTVHPEALVVLRFVMAQLKRYWHLDAQGKCEIQLVR